MGPLQEDGRALLHRHGQVSPWYCYETKDVCRRRVHVRPQGGPALIGPTEVHLQGHVQRRDAPPLGRRHHGPEDAAEAREARESFGRGAREAEPGLEGWLVNWWVR